MLSKKKSETTDKGSKTNIFLKHICITEKWSKGKVTTKLQDCTIYPVCLWSDQPLYDIPGQLVPASLSSLWNVYKNEGKIDSFYENSIGYVPFVLPYT